jgi:hypothetical protein
MAITLKKKPPHVCIAFPAYTGTVHMGTMRSVIADIMQLAQRGVIVSIADECGNALIGDCRAKIVAGFLENEAFTHLIMIDHDVAWATGALVRLVEHTMKPGVDLVCAMYPQRSDPLTFNFRSALDNGEGLEIDSETKLLEVWGVPAGCICLTRTMLQKLVQAHPELEFMAERGKMVDGTVKARMKCHALFESYWVKDANGRTSSKLGEDYAFCQRWRDLGGKVWIDPYIQTSHTGNKTFVGQLSDWFEATSERQTIDVRDDEEVAA